MGALIAIALLWVVIASSILLWDRDAERRAEDREIRRAIKQLEAQRRTLRAPRSLP